MNGDAAFYERYYATAFAPDASAHLGFGLSIYPNTGIIDAALSVSRDGVQDSVFASRRISGDQRSPRVGPLRIEVLEPLRQIRVVLEDTDGLAADLIFTAESTPLEEQRLIRTRGTSTASDRSRFVQFGSWQGWVEVHGTRIDCSNWHGVRDRSWGIRRQATAEDMETGDIKPIFAVWSVLHFPDSFLQTTLHEAPDGVSHVRMAMRAPRLQPHEVEPNAKLERTDDVRVDIDYLPGSRRPVGASIKVGPRGPMDFTVDVEPRSVFQMKGLGYYHPQRGHGRDQGSESVLREQWSIAELDPLALENVHAQQLAMVRRSDGVEGIGIFEHIAMGPHAPSALPDGLAPPVQA
ncbi:hypothetical protein [Rhodococcus pyridinivorans]|uniref:hypothetical protein n=1 Tax=Rhodococcus pyridinivorans TaxID=103816 RepID=UPI0022839F4D|nr:hypothetical protein [Rhodococcus pyridinivorans]WAL49285.1 hypothetical protein OQN32_26805 [Rhodococcus pyridinivorans]